MCDAISYGIAVLHALVTNPPRYNYPPRIIWETVGTDRVLVAASRPHWRAMIITPAIMVVFALGLRALARAMNVSFPVFDSAVLILGIALAIIFASLPVLAQTSARSDGPLLTLTFKHVHIRKGESVNTADLTSVLVATGRWQFNDRGPALEHYATFGLRTCDGHVHWFLSMNTSRRHRATLAETIARELRIPLESLSEEVHFDARSPAHRP